MLKADGGERQRMILGAANRTRTCDPVITNDVLYQLSYCGEPWRGFGSGPKTPAPDIGRAAILQEKRGLLTGTYPPQRDKNPRQPPVWLVGWIGSANSLPVASSSIPGSSGARTIGITAGMFDKAALG